MQYSIPPDAGVDVHIGPITTPPEGLELQRLPDSELAKYSLPKTYNPARTPRAWESWNRALSKQVRFVHTAHVTLSAKQLPAMQTRAGQAVTPETSHNWSGAYVGRAGLEQITSVHGIWRVPAITPGRAPMPVSTEWKSSTWVGLDGYRPASRSMPQIGTEQRLLANGTASYSVWMWWWGLGQPLQLPPPFPVSVSANNDVLAMVQMLDAASVCMTFVNLSTGHGMSYYVTSVDFHALPYNVEGRTAEWIFEAPTDPPSRRFYTLPRFEQVRFTDCSCTSELAGVPSERTAEAGSLIRMVDWDDPIQPGRPIAMPSVSGAVGSLAVDYVGR